MNTKLKWTLIIVVVVAVLAAGIYWLVMAQNARYVKLESFAKCVSDSGAKFYGAFWCPHCQSQKAMFQTLFQNASKSLPYIECSTPDGKSQLEICKTEEIKSYPTWKFANGVTRSGEIPLKDIANNTNCPLP